MTAPEEVGKTVRQAVSALSQTPLVLAILIFNLMYMGLNAWQTHTARAAFVNMMHETLRNCAYHHSSDRDEQ